MIVTYLNIDYCVCYVMGAEQLPLWSGTFKNFPRAQLSILDFNIHNFAVDGDDK